jgi:hypothetical protein
MPAAGRKAAGIRAGKQATRARRYFLAGPGAAAACGAGSSTVLITLDIGRSVEADMPRMSLSIMASYSASDLS